MSFFLAPEPAADNPLDSVITERHERYEAPAACETALARGNGVGIDVLEVFREHLARESAPLVAQANREIVAALQAKYPHPLTKSACPAGRSQQAFNQGLFSLYDLGNKCLFDTVEMPLQRGMEVYLRVPWSHYYGENLTAGDLVVGMSQWEPAMFPQGHPFRLFRVVCHAPAQRIEEFHVINLEIVTNR